MVPEGGEHDRPAGGLTQREHRPQRAYEVTETSAALALVAAGLGIAVLPDSVRSAPREGVLCKDIEDALPVPLALAWRADDASPLLRNLLKVLEQNDVFLEGPEGVA
ncbi:LysR substrate-binding domain-containing protein [Streptomyces himalayensis]|uniref:LysR substrate-binding domain-containing protein n=1 Tax=Streptomyces himalayensis TaxID=2820085 RepID=UPI00215D6F7B|nr:LysR substrate-binding domain-containing protein [Streptomyces himalayensis]